MTNGDGHDRRAWRIFSSVGPSTWAAATSTVPAALNRSVTSIRDIADQSASAMEQTAASSIQLAELGRELQGMAGHFRL